MLWLSSSTMHTHSSSTASKHWRIVADDLSRVFCNKSYMKMFQKKKKIIYIKPRTGRSKWKWYFSCCWLFSKLTFSKKSSRKTTWVSNGLAFFRSRSGSKLFAKIISRQQKSPLARKELIWAMSANCNGMIIMTVWVVFLNTTARQLSSENSQTSSDWVKVVWLGST